MGVIRWLTHLLTLINVGSSGVPGNVVVIGVRVEVERSRVVVLLKGVRVSFLVVSGVLKIVATDDSSASLLVREVIDDGGDGTGGDEAGGDEAGGDGAGGDGAGGEGGEGVRGGEV